MAVHNYDHGLRFLDRFIRLRRDGTLVVIFLTLVAILLKIVALVLPWQIASDHSWAVGNGSIFHGATIGNFRSCMTVEYANRSSGQISSSNTQICLSYGASDNDEGRQSIRDVTTGNWVEFPDICAARRYELAAAMGIPAEEDVIKIWDHLCMRGGFIRHGTLTLVITAMLCSCGSAFFLNECRDLYIPTHRSFIWAKVFSAAAASSSWVVIIVWLTVVSGDGLGPGAAIFLMITAATIHIGTLLCVQANQILAKRELEFFQGIAARYEEA